MDKVIVMMDPSRIQEWPRLKFHRLGSGLLCCWTPDESDTFLFAQGSGHALSTDFSSPANENRSQLTINTTVLILHKTRQQVRIFLKFQRFWACCWHALGSTSRRHIRNSGSSSILDTDLQRHFSPRQASHCWPRRPD